MLIATSGILTRRNWTSGSTPRYVIERLLEYGDLPSVRWAEGISAKVQTSLELVGQTPLATQFYLAGGTAIALFIHLLKSLMYFEDAEADPMSEMLKQEVQALFRQL
ncbi:MAG: hypothetical protein ACE5OS_10840 [Anaerolineae bacterium]